MDRFFTVTHLDGSTRTYDNYGRLAYTSLHNHPHITIRPEPTQSSGCVAANDAWNNGGRQAWLDLEIQAHVKVPVGRPRAQPKYDVPYDVGGSAWVFCRNCGIRHNSTFECPTCGVVVDVRTGGVL